MRPDSSELQHAVSQGDDDSQPTAVRRQKPPDFKGIRLKYPSAYQPWSEQEDAQLRRELSDSLSLAEIARTHGRPVSAIRSRVRNMGL